jgi:hypothetical protein
MAPSCAPGVGVGGTEQWGTLVCFLLAIRFGRRPRPIYGSPKTEVYCLHAVPSIPARIIATASVAAWTATPQGSRAAGREMCMCAQPEGAWVCWQVVTSHTRWSHERQCVDLRHCREGGRYLEPQLCPGCVYIAAALCACTQVAMRPVPPPCAFGWVVDRHVCQRTQVAFPLTGRLCGDPAKLVHVLTSTHGARAHANICGGLAPWR